MEKELVDLADKHKKYKKIEEELEDEIFELNEIPEKLEKVKNQIKLDKSIFDDSNMLNDVIEKIMVDHFLLDITFKHPFSGLKEVKSSGPK